MKTFMGVPVKEKDGVNKVSRADFNKILADNGVTKEVRDVIAAAEEKIAEEAIKELGKQVVATKETAKLELGAGNNKTTVTVKGKTGGINPTTKQSIDLYGVTTYQTKKVMPKSLREGVIAKVRSDIEKAFS